MQNPVLMTNELTFPEKRRLVAVHVLLGDQAKVGHGVGLHALEGAMFCNLLNGVLAMISTQEVRHTPDGCRQVL